MKIALIYPKIGMYKELLGTDGYVENMSTYPPLSLAYAAAVIRKAGHEAFIIDGNILNLDMRTMCRRIREIAPDLLGFTLTAPTFQPVYRWIAALKDSLHIPVIVGGGLLKLYPAEVMRYEKIDYAVSGTGRLSLPQFFRAYTDGKDFRGIPGLCFRRDGRAVLNDPDTSPEDMDDLPYPARELLPMEKYNSPFSEKRNFTPFLTSRGCVFRCAYCCLPGPLRLRRTESVLDELEECYHRFKVRDLDMYDTVFTADKTRVREICAGIRRKDLRFSWIARTHINLVDEDILREMAASGCRMLMYGIESVNADILRNLGRPVISLPDIKRRISLTRRAGIAAFGFFMLGCPAETEETIRQTVQASRVMGLDFAQFTSLTPIGGTPLYEQYKQTYKQDYWSRVVAGTVGSGGLYPVQTGLSKRDIVRSVRKANMDFYFRPAQLARIAVRVRSLRQLLNFIRAGSNIVFSFIRRRGFSDEIDTGTEFHTNKEEGV